MSPDIAEAYLDAAFGQLIIFFEVGFFGSEMSCYCK